MEEENAMKEGWNLAARLSGADFVAQLTEEEYDLYYNENIKPIEDAIKKLEDAINAHPYRNANFDSARGYLLEEWGAKTLNINAVKNGSSDYAAVPLVNEKNSADIVLNSGAKYSAKSYADAGKSAAAQAKFNDETGLGSYHGFQKLVTADQYEDAVKYADRQAMRNIEHRPEIAAAYKETSDTLTPVVKNEDGIESEPISKEKLEEVTRDARKENFDAEKYGIVNETEIDVKWIFDHATKAGLTATAITLSLQLLPEIFKAIDYLQKNREIDIEQWKKFGIKAIPNGAIAFLRGFVSSVLVSYCKKGAFGEEFVNIDPIPVGFAVVLIIQTAICGVMVATGKMQPQQMGDNLVKMTLTYVGLKAGIHIGGMIGQTIGFEFPVLGYLLGSLIGATIVSIYDFGKKKLISFCVDTGFTCFGLVDQNYKLPVEVLEEIGVETIPTPETQVERVDVPKTRVETTTIETAQYETVNITVLRRGIISVNKVGYVF